MDDFKRNRWECRGGDAVRQSGRMTPHYSRAELANLISAAEKVCGESPAILPQLPGFDGRQA
jgi:hypothetical protein